MPNFVPSFLSKFSSDPRFALPLPFLWTVTIDGGVTSQISSALQKIGYNWSVEDALKWIDISSNNILVAQEVTIPSESYETVILGPDSNRGGYMPGYGVTQRTDFLSRNLTINFIETQSDIETLLFRPWIVAIGVDGMIGGRLRSKATLTQYDRAGKIRKTYTFDNIFPTNTEGATISYSADDFTVKTVTFGYTRYDVYNSQDPVGPAGDINIIQPNLA